MHKIILAGYGGQGMLLCGQLLAYAAMQDGFNVTWLPTYGPEMRGGAAACSVVISEKPVGSPVIESADAIVATSQPAFNKYHSYVAPGGCCIYNSALVTLSDERADIKYIGLDFSQLAHELGNMKVSNMIVLGCLNQILDCVKITAIQEALKYKFGANKANVLAINEKAILLGAEKVRAV